MPRARGVRPHCACGIRVQVSRARRRDHVPGSSLRECAGGIHRRDCAGASASAVAGLRSRTARGPRRACTRRVVRAYRRKAVARCGVLCLPRCERRAVLPAWRLPEADRGARRIRSRITRTIGQEQSERRRHGRSAAARGGLPQARQRRLDRPIGSRTRREHIDVRPQPRARSVPVSLRLRAARVR